MKHLFGIRELDRAQLDELLDLAETFVGNGSPSQTLQAKTIAPLFFEDSTRTRASFEMAALKLGANVLDFDAKTSSLNKGESVRDTAQTIQEMGIDAFIVRHKSGGIPQRIAEWTGIPVINAGDGAHEHPTQALLDCLTLRQALNRKDLKGIKIAFVGDFAHSRVMRSSVHAFSMLGAELTLVAPSTMHPSDMSVWPITVKYNLDEVIKENDIIYSIRLQQERISKAVMPSMREYITRYCISLDRLSRMEKDQLIMDAGPVLRGVQMSAEVLEDPRCLVSKQVANGIPVRMAVLQSILGGAQ